MFSSDRRQGGSKAARWREVEEGARPVEAESGWRTINSPALGKLLLDKVYTSTGHWSSSLKLGYLLFANNSRVHTICRRDTLARPSGKLQTRLGGRYQANTEAATVATPCHAQKLNLSRRLFVISTTIFPKGMYLIPSTRAAFELSASLYSLERWSNVPGCPSGTLGRSGKSL